MLTVPKEESEESRTQNAFESPLRSADSKDRPPSAKRNEFDSTSEFSFQFAANDTIDQITTTFPGETSFQPSACDQKTDSEQVAPAYPQIRQSGLGDEWSAPTSLPEPKYYYVEPPKPSLEGEDLFRTPVKTPVETHQTRMFKGVEPSDPSYSQRQNGEKDEISQVNSDTGLFHAGPNKRSTPSQVIRKINSGFEILRPGTLDRPQPHDDTKLERDIDVEKKTSRKLQRKSRDVGHSRDSRFSEGT